MRRMLGLLAVLLAVSLACEDPTGILGPLDFGIIEGREQTVTAGADELPEPAVAKVWQDASGNAFLGVGPMPLYAQTTVKGVQGAVVCVGETPIEGDPLVPHARCTATDANGNATFHLTPSTRAAVHKTPIVAEYEGEALTPDTVIAVVVAGAVAPDYYQGAAFLRSSQPREIPEGAAFAADAYDNPIRGTCPLFAEGDTIASTVSREWPGCRSLFWDEAPADAPTGYTDITGTFAVLDSLNQTVGHGVYQLEKIPDGTTVLQMFAYGLERPCDEPGVGAC